MGFNPWVWKIPWRRKRQPTPAFLPWTEEPVWLQSMGLRRVEHNWATNLSLSFHLWSLDLITQNDFTIKESQQQSEFRGQFQAHFIKDADNKGSLHPVEVVRVMRPLDIMVYKKCLEEFCQEEKRHKNYCLQISEDLWWGKGLDSSVKVHGAEPTQLYESGSKRKISDTVKDGIISFRSREDEPAQEWIHHSRAD